MSSLSRKRGPPQSLDRSVTPPQIKRRPPVSDAAIDQDHVERLEVLPTRSSVIKIVSWNVNGTRPFLQKQISFSARGAPSLLRSVLKRHGWPGFLCLQEVKIAPSDISSQRQLEKAANDKALPGEPIYSIIFSLPRDKYNATGFGGKVHGVATIIRNDLEAATKSLLPDWDREGRILIHELECGLVLINGYWVNGTDHTYRDSITGEVSGVRHDLKLRYHRSILKEVQAYENVNKLVILLGDMNVARQRIDGHPNLRTSPIQHVRNREDFNDKFFTGPEGMRGIDVFRHFHGERRKYTWHSTHTAHGRVCDRVDYVIASRDLMSLSGAVTATDICDNADDKHHSDHVPLWVEVDLSKLRNVESPDEQSVGAVPEHSERSSAQKGEILVQTQRTPLTQR